MLDAAVKFLADEVNVHLLKRTGTDFGKTSLGALVDDSGKWVLAADRIGVSVVNIEEERLMRSQLPERAYVNGNHVMLQPDLKINLHILFAARFGRYDHALRYIGHVLTFFQAHPSFTPEEYPGLDPQISKLTVEMMTYNTEQLNQLWAYLGAKYLPSAVFRVRMIALQDEEPMAVGKPITSIETVLHDK